MSKSWKNVVRLKSITKMQWYWKYSVSINKTKKYTVGANKSLKIFNLTTQIYHLISKCEIQKEREGERRTCVEDWVHISGWNLVGAVQSSDLWWSLSEAVEIDDNSNNHRRVQRGRWYCDLRWVEWRQRWSMKLNSAETSELEAILS